MHFIRCIIPNKVKQCGHFEEELILSQLNTSCVLSYARFIRFGFSKCIDFEKLVKKCRLSEDDLNKELIDPLIFYSEVLLSIGFKFDEFKIGNGAIFLNSNKFELMEKFFSDIEEPRMTSANKNSCEPK